MNNNFFPPGGVASTAVAYVTDIYTNDTFD